MSGFKSDRAGESTMVADAKKDVLPVQEQSKLATEREHSMGTLEAIKLYPKAIFWASIFCWALVMVGYDSGIIFSLYALPAFTKKYGQYYGPDVGYEISAKWQNVLGMGTPVGQSLGALFASHLMERWGRRKVFAASLLCTTSFIFLQTFAPNIHVLAAGEFLAGLLYGTYVVLAPTYASEVCPVCLRGILNASINLAYVIGQLIAAGVGQGVSTRSDQWAYRIPFAVQWVWIPFLALAIAFAPESPWWLAKQGRMKEAEASLRRLAVDSPKVDIQATLAMIQLTLLHEMEVQKGATFAECFRGSNRIRTEVAVMVQVWQVVTGISLIGYATYFFELAGMPVAASFDMGLGNTAIGFVATCGSWFLMSLTGRRRIYMGGVGIMALCLLLIGILDCLPNYTAHPAYTWTQAVFLDLLTLVYQGTIGPVAFVILAEVGAARLRSHTVALAEGIGSVFQIITTIIFPYMINASAGNWRGKTGFFFGGLSILATIWCFFRLPETKNRTFEELDHMFEEGVPPRKFKGYTFETLQGEG